MEGKWKQSASNLPPQKILPQIPTFKIPSSQRNLLKTSPSTSPSLNPAIFQFLFRLSRRSAAAVYNGGLPEGVHAKISPLVNQNLQANHDAWRARTYYGYSRLYRLGTGRQRRRNLLEILQILRRRLPY